MFKFGVRKIQFFFFILYSSLVWMLIYCRFYVETALISYQQSLVSLDIVQHVLFPLIEYCTNSSPLKE